MNKTLIYTLFLCLYSTSKICSQGIADFTPLSDFPQNVKFAIPQSHTFQKIIESGDPLTTTGNMYVRNDFTAYVPINNSSTLGYLSINHEATPGGVTVLDINFDENGTKLWNVSASQALDFTNVGGTKRNCSGGITPWGTVLSCEESVSGDDNMDGYNDIGWAVEIDPATKTVLGKRWAMGNFAHENAVVHTNERTIYQGIDAAIGYLYKFVATAPQDLSSGDLYVYSGPKNGANGAWIQIANNTPTESNTTVSQSTMVNATDFDNIEDVEIGPDGYVYFTSKAAGIVYRFMDSDPISGTDVPIIETFVDGIPGCDNLAFDCEGNLWIYEDGGRNHIWVVKSGSRKEEIFARLPAGSEPTGITFSPDCRFLFMSIQHPSSVNLANQADRAGNIVNFDKSISLVIARKEELGSEVGCSINAFSSDIINGQNDVEELADGTMYATSSDIELTFDNNRGNQTVGLRFENMLIPKGVRITNAYLQFTTDERSSVPTSVLIQGEADGSSTAFSNTSFDLTSRAKTASCISWDEIPEWAVIDESGSNQQSPNLRLIIEEITDQSSWQQGNAINLFISGNGRRVARSFESDPTKVTQLFIEFETCPPSDCTNHGDQTLIGNLDPGVFTIGRNLVIRGNMAPNNNYYMSAGQSIELKPNTEICQCGTATFTIEQCED